MSNSKKIIDGTPEAGGHEPGVRPRAAETRGRHRHPFSELTSDLTSARRARIEAKKTRLRKLMRRPKSG